MTGSLADATDVLANRNTNFRTYARSEHSVSSPERRLGFQDLKYIRGNDAKNESVINPLKKKRISVTQGVSGGIENILGSVSMDYSE